MATAGWHNVNVLHRPGRTPERGQRVENINIGPRIALFEATVFRHPDQQTEIVAINVAVGLTIPASPTVYWTFDAFRRSSSGQTRMTSAATAFNTGVTTLTAFVPATLGVDQNTRGNTNDVITIRGTPTGTGPNTVADMHVQILYKKTGRVGVP